MKNLLLYNRNMTLKKIIPIDYEQKIYDAIIPQKSFITLIGNIDCELNDIIVIYNDKREQEFIGIIETFEKTEKITNIAMLPFELLLDNELYIQALDGNVQDYIVSEITNNFISTDDVLLKFDIIFNDLTEETVTYKSLVDTNSLLEMFNEIYLNTGIYVDFTFNSDTKKIICNIHNANEEAVRQIRYDNPMITNKVDYKFSQYGNYSKCTINIKGTERYFSFYLREDNTVTTNPNDILRIKQVKNKNVTLNNTYNTSDELAEALILLAQKTLCGNAFAYSIEFNIIRNAITDWKYRQRCKFLAKDRLYESFITKIEYLSDKEAKITLGAYRYTLTDKFKNLAKKVIELNDVNGVQLNNALGQNIFWFTQEEGNLYLNYPEGETQPNIYIEDDYLYYEYDDSEPDFSVENGELIYNN